MDWNTYGSLFLNQNFRMLTLFSYICNACKYLVYIKSVPSAVGFSHCAGSGEVPCVHAFAYYLVGVVKNVICMERESTDWSNILLPYLCQPTTTAYTNIWINLILTWMVTTYIAQSPCMWACPSVKQEVSALLSWQIFLQCKQPNQARNSLTVASAQWIL